ncbi:MAG: septation protein A [Betaproteobacteria bacterium]|jgi:intracellular septation protein|nr:septation protein A [Betaproteobacteria bacterium]NBO89217.1 septation protein A [Betaproteobacteria bacterium]NBU45190.1 septation protein A [Betaproteobacteria bacterium]NDF65157.1 septation protein A [Betaproteobacteria bacterium]
MKLLVDFFPILLFFLVFKTLGIYAATAVAIVATVAQIAWLRWRNGRVEAMQWLSLGVIVVFGGATLVAQDDTFIKWKPTVLYWLMGGGLLVAEYVFKRNGIRALMGSQLELPDNVWRHLLHAWAGFFSVMGVINLWVAYHFDTDTWVNFKLFGGLGLMVLFVLGQAVYLSKHMKQDDE